MSLKKYLSKRNLKQSREPSTEGIKKSQALHFCVQKHAARHLHYDFRIEHKGVLLSWAVPKGPSSNPKDKRLAIKVEDHPLEYQYFEGIIPKGNYGAGTVEIWDNGSYAIPESSDIAEIEKSISQGLKKGHFSVLLEGRKLKGEYVFQKLKADPEDNAWLLIKRSDSRTVKSVARLTSAKNPSAGTRSKMPDFISPMLATLIDKPFNNEDWLFEVKWDGYRTLAFINKGQVQLKSRNKHLLNDKFPTIIANLKKIDNQVIFDGELVVLDSEGKSHFQLMQNYQREGKGTLYYYVFDLLYKDGQDLRQLPLIERKEILKKYLKDYSLPLIRYSDHIVKDGEAFFKEASKIRLEGIIGKEKESTYQSRRSKDWVKIKTTMRQEVVIGGFTAPRGSRKKLGALLVGVYDDLNALVYSGHVGGGFNAVLLKEVYEQLQPLIQKKSPFKTEPKANAAVTWVKPKLICEVSFAEWTQDNLMRQPIFHGLRSDKSPKTVKREIPDSHKKDPSVKKKTASKKSDSNNSTELSLTNLDKVYWPKEKYTKGDLLDYYQNISQYILPYLKDRPIMLHRYPDGIEGKEFYQKDINFSHPAWIKICPIKQEGEVNHYLLINDLRSLLYAVNLGSIDLHPFLAHCKNLKNPDYCIIDLDPHGIPFEKVIEVALAFHQILTKIGIKHYCKTSGSKGLHICIPFHGKYDFEQSKQFAELLSGIIQKQFSRFISLERNPHKREKKIYLDCLQNRYGQTLVAPYAVRPRPGALVSTPIAWDEVNKDLDPARFTLETIPARLKKKGDLFKPVLGPGINLKKSLDLLQEFL